MIAAHEGGECILVPVKGEPHQLFIRGLVKAHDVAMIQGFASDEGRHRSPLENWEPGGLSHAMFGLDSSRRWIVKTRWITTIAFVCLGAFAVLAQNEEDVETAAQDAVGGLPFAGEVDVTVVNVNVYVTDKQGLAVTDLKADDFVLTQDGTAKPITNFGLFTDEIYRSYYGDSTIPQGLPTPTPIPGAEELSKDSFRPVYVVLYFDNENSRSLDRNRLITQIRTFIRENLHPPVQMMVISYNKSYDVLQSFTTTNERSTTPSAKSKCPPAAGPNSTTPARTSSASLPSPNEAHSQTSAA